MIKKLVFLFFVSFMAITVCAHESKLQEDVDLSVGLIDPTDPVEDNHRSPMRPPRVYHDGNILYTQYVPFDVTLEVRDNGGTVVYTMFVPASTTSVVLPSILSGTYEIQLIEGYWYFYGWIDL